MKRLQKTVSRLAAAVAIGMAGLMTPVLAAEELYSGDVVQIVPAGEVFNFTLSIAGPNGFYAQALPRPARR